jgi:purine-nucleoside/S-methyl-5'-thioadenosine phosphorylase / adenosine deaminase
VAIPTRARPLADGAVARVVHTSRADGDLAVTGAPHILAGRRARVVDRPWVWLHQVHGNRVVEVDDLDTAIGAEADGAVTRRRDCALAVHTADCAPITLTSPQGVIGIAHAGWRGLSAGVVGETVEAMRHLGASAIEATIGPCIHVECYQFGPADLAEMVERFGGDVEGRTTGGAPALDVPACVRAALRHAGVDDVTTIDVCTSCDETYFSHRARGDEGRQATLVWMGDR